MLFYLFRLTVLDVYIVCRRKIARKCVLTSSDLQRRLWWHGVDPALPVWRLASEGVSFVPCSASKPLLRLVLAPALVFWVQLCVLSVLPGTADPMGRFTNTWTRVHTNTHSDGGLGLTPEEFVYFWEEECSRGGRVSTQVQGGRATESRSSCHPW